jgi:mono/diheme cytochrome c family protein
MLLSSSPRTFAETGGDKMRPFRLAPARIRYAFGVALSVYALVGVFSVTGHAGQQRTVAQGVYSNDQAKRGQDLYTAQCVACHGEMLEGAVGPALTGDDFLADFGGHPVKDLVDKIQNTMPQQTPGTLTHAQAIDLAAYVLKADKYPAGQTQLSDATLFQVTFRAGNKPPAAAPTAAAGAVQLTAVANLAQFMRGITFPNANIIFNTQLNDPGKVKPKMPVPYDYVLWGQTVYYGWQAVDQAILTLKETTPLFLLPGRRCQNGRPVPLNKADFQQYTHDLINFTDELWKAAQTRNVDTVSDLSEKLNNTCANCHKVYRDVGTSEGGGLGTDRCKQ